ncbi:hypothetical protein [Xylanibacter muris]|uniref:Uncharacterized protein n=1 Tax=Xylanibacter muris TaxID=2736290 RepID=A0ABX2AKI4_9BACT|nr:hypothetical protein [Xylanibacter muris]NPD91716.1 hypothetical protein [Xylanibacter muris]
MTNKIIIVMLSLLCMTTFSACDSDSDPTPQQLGINKIIGEWVYDHPEEGIWEKQKFMPSGVFYYSNTSLGGWKFSNDTKDGRYSIENDNRISMNVVMGGVSMRLMLKVIAITDYAYTAEYTNGGTSVGTFTYARQMGSVNLKPGESCLPEYSQFIKTNIKGYGSHNEKVVKVENTDGTITAIAAGHTYIDIITDQGTAVYEVTVFDHENMFEDYSFAFGKTIPEIVSLKGGNYLWRDDKNGLVYYSDDYLTDTVKYITGIYDKTHVEFILLSLNDNVSQTNIKKFLDNKYEHLSSDNGIHSYVTDQKINGNPIGALYNTKASTISFVQILPTDRWTDFSYLFGQTDNTVNKEMTEWKYEYLFSDYSYSKDGSDYYNINDSKDAVMVGFVFNSKKKMCEYWVYLDENFMSSAKDILTWLKSKYILNSSESNNSQYVFYDKSNRLKVVFSATGYVSYTDKSQTPFTPADSKSSYITPSQIKAKALEHISDNK